MGYRQSRILIMVGNIIDRDEILARAKLTWDNKTELERNKAGNKYQLFLSKYVTTIHNWHNCFDDLAKSQQNIIIKGELIRFYDSLPNTDKTKIMYNFGLSEFSSKWYKLNSEDKRKLLNYIY